MKFFRREKPTLGSDKNGGLVLTDYEPLTITITHVLNAKCGLGWTSNSHTGLPVPVIDFHGKVIFDNKANPAEMENHASRSEFIEAMEKGSSKVSRYSSTMLQKNLYFAKRLENGTVLRFSCQQYTAGLLMFGLSQELLCLLEIALIISGLAAAALSKKITTSIEKIDFENPETNETFSEFKPFIKRISNENFEKKQREEIRRQFSANVSHELKTPLTSISGFAEIMKSGSADEKKRC